MSTESAGLRSWFEAAASPRPQNHYQLLGLELFESRPEVIDAAATRLTGFLQGLADEADREQAEPLLRDVAAAQLCLGDPDQKTAYDAQLRAESDDGDRSPAVPGEPVVAPEAVPRIKVAAAPAGSRGKARKSGRRRESAVFVPTPDFKGLESADPAPAASPLPAQTSADVLVPDVLVPDVLVPDVLVPDVERNRPVVEAKKKRPAAKQQLPQPKSPRSKSSTTRRKISASSWWLTIGVCGGSAAAVIALLVYLLGRSPPPDRSSSHTAESAFALPAGNVAENLVETPTTASRRRSATSRSGVRGYSTQEAAQRRQGIDSFAELGRSEAERLHRGEGLELPADAPRTKALPLALDAPAADESLLAYWPFEDQQPQQASDASLRGNQAKLDGKPAAIAQGMRGAALRLDGKDDCLQVPEGLVQGTAGTISFWFRCPAVAGTHCLVSSAPNSARLQLVIQDGRLVGDYASAADRQPLQTEAILNATTWHHLALTWKSSGQVLLYLDGQLAARQLAERLPDPTGILIGKDAGSGHGSAFDVDEIRLYARPLSAEEVAAIVSAASR
jgi:hypothetical protein